MAALSLRWSVRANPIAFFRDIIWQTRRVQWAHNECRVGTDFDIDILLTPLREEPSEREDEYDADEDRKSTQH